MTSAFGRAIAGEKLVIYDPYQLPELSDLAAVPGWASPMLTWLQASGFSVTIICRHSRAGTFYLTSKAAMQRCRPFTSQALVNITYRACLQEQVAAKTETLSAGHQAPFSQFCRHGVGLVLGNGCRLQTQLSLRARISR